MGNHDAAVVAGKSVVEIIFISGKKLTLNNVFHVPNSRKNLAYASLMFKNELKIIFEVDTCIVSKNGASVRNGYYCDDMYKLSIINNEDMNLVILLSLLIFGMHD